MPLLLESQVVHKKQTIRLQLLSGGLSLIFAGRPNEPQLIAVPEIKAQFVNSADSPKALLRVTTNDEQVFLFQFPSHAERDGFKDALAQLISQYRSTGEWDTASMDSAAKPAASGTADASNQNIPSSAPPKLSKEDIKIRQNLLANDPSLRRLHRDLVMAGHFTEEEFWQPRQHLLRIQKEQNSQEVGLSTELLHEPKPSSTSTGSDIKYTLTPQIIQSIFLHHPKLQAAYEENVPDKISEKDFWTRCFQSAFFYRDRQQGQKSKDVLFDKIASEEDVDMSKPTTKNLLDFLTDMQMILPDVSEDYGNAPDATMKSGQSKQSVSLIRKLNRHGDLVLSADKEAKKTKFDKDDPNLPRHKQILREVMVIKDLLPPTPPPVVPLNIRNRDAFFEGRSSQKTEHEKVDEIKLAAEIVLKLKNWQQNMDKDYISPDACQEFFDEQFESMNAQVSPVTRPSIPADSFQDFKAIHITTTELLRHFWLAQPSPLPQDKSKCKRIVSTMKKVRERIVNWKQDAERSAVEESDLIQCQQMADSLLTNVDKLLAAG